MPDLKDDILPSAAPTEEEIRRWNALPRDEQVRRMRALFADPASTAPGQRSMTEIRDAALARIAKRDHG